MSKTDPLRRYRAKRDFTRTIEPAGAAPRRKPAKGPVFVIQKHDASRLHYDLRLEVDGVLKSWAVPKGPSTDPAQKRLAVYTEDHPMEYADFEGTIPKGEYGGGTVLVWDTGTYRNLKTDQGLPIPMTKTLEAGHIAVWLEGRKLRGGYNLVKAFGPGKNWLFIKMKDVHADASRDILVAEPRSALTDRCLEEIRQGASDKRPAPPKAARKKPGRKEPG